MGKIVLPYRIHQSRLGTFDLLPLCTVVLIGRRRRVPVNAVIDSGATLPFFLASSAEDAGVDLRRSRPFTAVFGGSTAFGRLVESYIAISGHRLRTEIDFVDDIWLGHALLGRKGVFTSFNEVVFIERNELSRVELRW